MQSFEDKNSRANKVNSDLTKGLPVITGKQIKQAIVYYKSKQKLFRWTHRIISRLKFFYENLDTSNKTGNLTPENYFMFLVIFFAEPKNSLTEEAFFPFTSQFNKESLGALQIYFEYRAWPFTYNKAANITGNDLKNAIDYATNGTRLREYDFGLTRIYNRLNDKNRSVEHIKLIYLFYNENEKSGTDRDLVWRPLKIKFGDPDLASVFKEIRGIYYNPAYAKDIVAAFRKLFFFKPKIFNEPYPHGGDLTFDNKLLAYRELILENSADAAKIADAIKNFYELNDIQIRNIFFDLAKKFPSEILSISEALHIIDGHIQHSKPSKYFTSKQIQLFYHLAANAIDPRIVIKDVADQFNSKIGNLDEIFQKGIEYENEARKNFVETPLSATSIFQKPLQKIVGDYVSEIKFEPKEPPPKKKFIGK